MSEKLSANQEDYLEAIALLIAEKGAARVKDIARQLGVTSASVNGAIRALSETGHVLYSPYESLRLTQKGELYAHRVFGRHSIIQKFLTEVLLIEADEAKVTACCIEHVVTDAVADKIRILTEHLRVDGVENVTQWRTELVVALEGGNR